MRHVKYIKLKSRRYLGNKYSLLPFLHNVIKPLLPEINTVADLFAGTGVVGEYFLEQGKDVIFNDILYSNYIIYEAWFGKEPYNDKKIHDIINQFNTLKADKLKDNYFSINFKDTYFSYDNCKIIGYIREQIEIMYTQKKINYRERAILIAALLYSMDRIANTVGHYDSYLTSKSGLNNILILHCPLIKEYKNQHIKIYRQDANKLIKKIEADLVYIDPPYNSRQYSDMYHLLENVAEWKKPEVQFKAKKMDRTHIKSAYSLNQATKVFEDLIKNINAKYILVSYNDMRNNGNHRSNAKIKDEDLIRILKSKGELQIIEKEYYAFTTGKSINDNLKERFFLCKVKQNKKQINKPIIKIDEFVKTPFNYTGGKYKLLPQLYKYFPNDLSQHTFVDLFTGGGNVGINVSGKKIICNDKNKHIIRLFKLLQKYSYSYIKDNMVDIINKYNLSQTSKFGYAYYNCDSATGLGQYNKCNYLQLRADYNELHESEKKDMYLMVLIVYSFNNQIRFNKKGKFNSPVGKRDFNKSNQLNLYKTISRIQQLNIEFMSKDFRDVNIMQYNNPYVYCDPPYYLGTATYNENGGWTKEDEQDLLAYLDKLNQNQIKFALSNVIEHKGNINQTLIDWALNNRYNIIYLDNNYSNSSYHKNKQKTKNKTVEVLITN